MKSINTNLRRLNPTIADQPNNPMRNAEHVAEMLKLMAHPHRLMILCLLVESEHNVGELVEALIDYTRYHRVLQYRLKSEEARTILEVLSGFCLDR